MARRQSGNKISDACKSCLWVSYYLKAIGFNDILCLVDYARHVDLEDHKCKDLIYVIVMSEQ